MSPNFTNFELKCDSYFFDRQIKTENCLKPRGEVEQAAQLCHGTMKT